MLKYTASSAVVDVGQRGFRVMLWLALGVHVLGLLLTQWMHVGTKEIDRTQVLNFRLGTGQILAPAVSLMPSEEEVATREVPKKREIKPEVPSPAARSPQPQKKLQPPPAPSPAPPPRRVSIRTPASTPSATLTPHVEHAPRRAPLENVRAQQMQKENSISLPGLSDLFGSLDKSASSAATGPSIGELTQVGVSEGDALSPQAEAARARYEQQISAWVARYRYYPAQAGGKEGRAIVRVRIDRQGFVRYYSIDESSGFEMFDRAAIDMIRRASPMPSVPMSYPAGNLIEFLIPITFKP